MAIGPSISLYLYDVLPDFNIMFWAALATSSIGFIFVSMVKPKERELNADAKKPSWDRFFLLKGLLEGLTLMFFSFAYGILSPYIAIY